MKKFLSMLSILLSIALFTIYFLNPFGAPGNSNKKEIVIIDTNQDDAVALTLQEKGFIKSFIAFDIALGIKGKKNKVEPGGYYLSKDMDAWEVIENLTNGPQLKWVTVPEGIRKEQIGERLQAALGWNNEELKKWNETYTTTYEDLTEGVYFPDKYLIPVDENGEEIAKRMIINFNEKMEPYFDKFAEKDIKWTTAIKLASIIEREAGGPGDMPLIAGVLWNRLLKNQKLEIDATIQYAMGKTNGKWWPTVRGSDIRNTDSPFNTYKFSGLPPTPIANPGISAIDAVLNPEETDCFYYLHDRSRQIHCSVTYEEHLENIEKYLN